MEIRYNILFYFLLGVLSAVLGDIIVKGTLIPFQILKAMLFKYLIAKRYKGI